MPQDDTLDNRQAYPRSFKFIGTVKTLKNTEQLVMVLHVKADAIVPDIVYVLTFRTMSTYFNERNFPNSTEFDRV